MYAEKIVEIAKKTKVFTTSIIREAIGVPPDKYASFNTEISRVEKAGKIQRLSKGLYAYITHTVFGASLPPNAEIARFLYIKDGRGYTYGPTFFNQIGLSTWLPQETYIKTLRYPTINLPHYSIKKAPRGCETCNTVYFQLLDCISDLDKYAIDADEPDKVIRDYINRAKIDRVKLIIYCSRHYKTILPKLLSIMEGYYL